MQRWGVSEPPTHFAFATTSTDGNLQVGAVSPADGGPDDLSGGAALSPFIRNDSNATASGVPLRFGILPAALDLRTVSSTFLSSAEFRARISTEVFGLDTELFLCEARFSQSGEAGAEFFQFQATENVDCVQGSLLAACETAFFEGEVILPDIGPGETRVAT